jgi:hypothetical protein
MMYCSAASCDAPFRVATTILGDDEAVHEMPEYEADCAPQPRQGIIISASTLGYQRMLPLSGLPGPAMRLSKVDLPTFTLW